jgi:hypothetical protein
VDGVTCGGGGCLLGVEGLLEDLDVYVAEASISPLSAIIFNVALPSIARLSTGFLRASYLGETVGRNSIRMGYALSRSPSFVFDFSSILHRPPVVSRRGKEVHN